MRVPPPNVQVWVGGKLETDGGVQCRLRRHLLRDRSLGLVRPEVSLSPQFGHEKLFSDVRINDPKMGFHSLKLRLMLIQ